MKKIFLLQALLLLATVAFAADKYRVVTIQILKSAQEPVTFTDRSPAIYAALYVSDVQDDSYRNDTLVANEAAIGIKEALEEAEELAEYDIPVYHFYSLCRGEECDSIELVTDNDLLIIVKNITLAPYQSAKKQYTDLYGSFYLVGTYVPYSAVFEVYDATTRTFSHRATLSDTLVWAENTLDVNQTLAELPSIEEAKPLAAREIGKLYAQKLAPYWRQVKRFFFVPSGKELTQAADFAENFEWDKAMQIWEKYTGNKNKKVAAQTAFNMALGCEMNGHYELAIEWLGYAEKIFPLEEITRYRAILQRRINESNRLQKEE
jgi:hypothetical protein